MLYKNRNHLDKHNKIVKTRLRMGHKSANRCLFKNTHFQDIISLSNYILEYLTIPDFLNYQLIF